MGICIQKISVCLTLFFLSFTFFQAKAQYSLDQLDLSRDVSAWFDRSIGAENTGILLGSYQEMPRVSRNTHQFFGSDLWTEATIKYREQVYDSIFGMYDIHADLFVIRHPADIRYHAQPIRLQQHHIVWFSLQEHTFRYYPDGVLHIVPGFFDELYIGDSLDLIVKRAKISQAISGEITFLPDDKYFVRIGDEYHRFRRKSSIMRLLKAHRKAIRKFIRSNKLIIKTDHDEDLARLAGFCDGLMQNP